MDLQNIFQVGYPLRDDHPRITLQNIVSTFSSRVQSVHLDQGCVAVPWASYNRKVFRALVSRLKSPKTTVLTFSSGKNVCTGAKTTYEARLGCRLIVSALQEHGFHVGFGHFSIENIVASVEVGWPLLLESIAHTYTQCSNYDPRLFPGLIFRMQNPRVVFLVFRGGRLVVTGYRASHVMQEVFAWFYDHVLVPFRDPRSTVDYQEARDGGFLPEHLNAFDPLGSEPLCSLQSY